MPLFLALLLAVPTLAQDASPDPPSSYGFGFVSSHDIRGRTVVLGTLPNAENGLRAGDIVYAVNGEPLALNVRHSAAFFDAEDAAPAALTLLRGLDTLTVSVDTLSYLRSDQRRVRNTAGCLTGDCMDGYGVRVDLRGEMYAGGWKEGFHHGLGTLTLADGETYAGEFLDGRYHGGGLHTWPDGSTWAVTYDGGFAISPGVYTDSLGVSSPTSPPRLFYGLGMELSTDTTGRYILLGMMPGGPAERGGLQPGDAFLTINDVPLEPYPTTLPFREAAQTPPSVFTVVRGADTLSVSIDSGPYEGGAVRRAARAFGCKGDCVNGYGDRTLPNGLRYDGEWADGFPHGRGTLYQLNGVVYTGAFIMDQRWGHGTLRWPDGATWEGEFEAHFSQGDGLYTDPGGRQSPGYPEDR